MHLVLPGLESCIILRLGVWNYSGVRGEASLHSPGKVAVQAAAPSPLWFLCVTKRHYLTKELSFCFFRALAVVLQMRLLDWWAKSEIFWSCCPGKGEGKEFNYPSQWVVGPAWSYTELLRMNQSNFWIYFYVNFIRNPRKTLEPPAEKSRVCWIRRTHSWSLLQPPHLPWGQLSQRLPQLQPAPKQANGGL